MVLHRVLSKFTNSKARVGTVSLGLLLVLSLSGGVEIIKNTLNVVKSRPVFRLGLPAGAHDVIELAGAVFWAGHSVATLY